MDWCKGVEFYEKLAQYHLRFAKVLADKYGFNFTYDVNQLGLYKDKKMISNMSYYKGDFNKEFYDCLLIKYGISRVQIEDLIAKMESSDFRGDIISNVLDVLSYTNYDIHELKLEYSDTSKLNNKYRTFKNHVKDKAIITDLQFDGFTFPTPYVHIKSKSFRIKCNLHGLGYENFIHYYQDYSLPPQTILLDKMKITVPVTDHVIQKGKLISFDQRVIIYLNESQN